jgi:hypothetical protein
MHAAIKTPRHSHGSGSKGRAKKVNINNKL